MDENLKIDDSIERALNILEHPETLTKEELQAMLEDDECLRACRDLMEGSRALAADIPLYTPDVEREWNRFNERHRTSRKRRWLISGSITGIAATIAVLIFFWTRFTINEVEPVTVFLANNLPQQVTLQTGNGELIALEGNKKLTAVGAQLQENELDYDTSNPSGEKVEMHSLSTPRGADFKVVLADGTEVWLNAESRLEYPAAFVGKERMVSLQGEAYFKVAKDAQRPFIIQTNNMRTRVLGTEFNVRNYSETDSHVTLIQGSVEVCNDEGACCVRLKPGEDAHLQPDGTFTMNPIDVDAYIYWKEGYFYFDNVTLLDIMQSLGRWYNVTIQFENPSAMNHRLYFLTERSAGLEQAITLLNRMKKVKITSKDGVVTIR